MNKYVSKTENHFKVSESSQIWQDPFWQIKNVLTAKNISVISDVLNLQDGEKNILKQNINLVSMKITPFLLLLIEKTKKEGLDVLQRQFLSLYTNIESLPEANRDTTYKEKENLPVLNTQNKYLNSRIISRIIGVCPSLCQYCFEASRTLKQKGGQNINLKEFKKLCGFIKGHDEIEEIILSGGEPMFLSNNNLEKYLWEIRNIPRKNENPLLIRIHTRNFTFNPYRFDKEFINLCSKYKVNSIGLHIAHPKEITSVMKNKILEIREQNPYMSLHLNTPLLKGVNDDFKTLKKLFLQARNIGIEPRYVYHTMPETPGGENFHIPIKDAISLMENFSINRASSIRPHFVIVPSSGKFEPSLSGLRNFEYIEDGKGIKYVNRKGEETIYRDPN